MQHANSQGQASECPEGTFALLPGCQFDCDPVLIVIGSSARAHTTASRAVITSFASNAARKHENIQITSSDAARKFTKQSV